MDVAKILVIDDDACMLDTLRGALEDAGHSVLACDGGLEGLRLANKHEPDLILLDVEMPRFTGLDVLRAVRHDPKRKATPVILMSGRDAAFLREAPHQPDLFLSKPFDLDVLLDRVTALLSPRSKATT